MNYAKNANLIIFNPYPTQVEEMPLTDKEGEVRELTDEEIKAMKPFKEVFEKEYFHETTWSFGKAYYVVYDDYEEIIYPQLILDDCIYWLKGDGESASLAVWDARKWLTRAPEHDLTPVSKETK